MRATPWPEDCTAAPLLWQCDWSKSYSTIHEVPTSKLANQTELALVLLLDRSNKKILFQVPDTKLNWRFHFGCRIGGKENEVVSILQGHGIVVDSIRRAGTMFFTFPRHDPMRVQILEAQVNVASTSTGGKWFQWDEIPYTEMWADDALWLPWFVEMTTGEQQQQQQQQVVEFEGHFLFDGNPGPNSGLVAHNCQRLDGSKSPPSS